MNFTQMRTPAGINLEDALTIRTLTSIVANPSRIVSVAGFQPADAEQQFGLDRSTERTQIDVFLRRSMAAPAVSTTSATTMTPHVLTAGTGPLAHCGGSGGEPPADKGCDLGDQLGQLPLECLFVYFPPVC